MLRNENPGFEAEMMSLVFSLFVGYGPGGGIIKTNTINRIITGVIITGTDNASD